jgi:hypothetical protein
MENQFGDSFCMSLLARDKTKEAREDWYAFPCVLDVRLSYSTQLNPIPTNCCPTSAKMRPLSEVG